MSSVTPRTAPLAVVTADTPTPVRICTPFSRASAANAAGTAPVPPIGYQTPSLHCMCAMPHSTAGEPYGEEPTYCTKWSSICATRGSRTRARMAAATVVPMRSAMTSRAVLISKFLRMSIVSRRSSTERQKKKRSEMPRSRSESCMNPSKPTSSPGE